MSAGSTRRALFGAGASMLASIPAAAGMTPPATHADADLLAACARFVALEAERRRLGKLADVLPTTHESDAAELALDIVSAEQQDLMQTMVDMPSRTFDGLRAKARALHTFFGGNVNEYGQHKPHKRLEWSLICDVAGSAAE